MLGGIYNAASALEAAERHHEVVAGNLAHASVPGYRRRVMAFGSFDDALAQTASAADAAQTTGSVTGQVRVDFAPGTVEFTGNALDLALRGDGFFVLEGPSGPVYTRNGVFGLSGDGVLQNSAGLAVQGTGGSITIPPGASEVVVQSDGGVFANGAQVGQIELATFKDPRLLIPVAATLFQAPIGVLPTSAEATVHQGYRESSNVQVVDELVEMITGMRHYEASQRALRTLFEAIEHNTRPQAT